MANLKKSTAVTPAKKASGGAKKTVVAKTAKGAEKVAAKASVKKESAKKTVIETTAKKGDSKEVVFTIEAPLATTVAVAGCFNNWSVTKNKLKKDKKGLWSVKIPLAAGRYEYKFVCDGVNWDEGENKIKNV
jgi:1,4-alpha-glucan branching enzyme